MSLGLAAAWALAGGTGCSQADTIVLVHVSGDVAGIQRLRATVTIDDRIRMLSFPDPPRPISLPTSFTIQIDRSVQGRLDVTLDGLDAADTELARGEGAIPNLNRGQRNDLDVVLTADGTPPTPDGGAGDDGGVTTDDGSVDAEGPDAADDGSGVGSGTDGASPDS